MGKGRGWFGLRRDSSGSKGQVTSDVPRAIARNRGPRARESYSCPHPDCRSRSAVAVCARALQALGRHLPTPCSSASVRLLSPCACAPGRSGFRPF